MAQDNDLPDPLEKPAPGPNQNTDELLSQMAGDEIDRLLAEAEVARGGTALGSTEMPTSEATSSDAPLELAAPAAQAASGDQPTAEQVDADTAQQLDALFAQLNETKPPEPEAAPEPAPAAVAASNVPAAPATPEAAEPADNAQLTQQLDELFRQLSSPPADAAQQPAPAATTAEAKQSDEAPTGASVDPAEQTGGLEKQVLAAEVLAAAAEEQPQARKKERVPWLLRVLVWINKPIEGCSDQFRSLLGKAALVTFVNAMLLLAYVLLIRRR